MATSKIDVVNRVLSELAEPPVTNVSDTPSSRLIERRFDELLPTQIKRANWEWAIKYVEDDSPLAQNEFPEWNHNYSLPGDFGKFYRLGINSFELTEWKVYGNILATNHKPIRYYYIVDDPNLLSLEPIFTDAMVLYTAARVCLVVTEDSNLMQYLMKEYEQKMMEAILNNSMQEAIRSKPHNDFDRIQYI